MSRPLVSVVLPTYRRAQLVSRAIESVFAQSWRPLQLIVVNDGSDDATSHVLASMASRAPADVEFIAINKAHGGVSSARNAGLRAARGGFVSFLDDDDWWLPEKTKRQVDEIYRSGADACCCLTFRGEQEAARGGANLIRGRDGARFVAREVNARITTLLVSAPVVARVGEFDEELSVYEDEEWKARLTHEADFCAVEEALVAYSRSAGSLSQAASHKDNLRRDEDFLRHLELIRMRCAGLSGWSEDAWKRRAAHVYDECAKHRLYVGDIEGARELYLRGLEICGPIMALPKLKTKLRKAWWMSWLGLKPRHPKFAQTAS